MKLRTRLSLFTVLIIVLLVAGLSISTLFFLRRQFTAEFRIGQLTTLNNFQRVCKDVTEIGDNPAAASYIESLKKTVPGIAYAVFASRKINYALGKDALVGEIYPSEQELFSSLGDPQPKMTS